MKKILSQARFFLLLAFLTPAMVFAALKSVNNLADLIDNIFTYLGYAFPLIVSFTIIVFIFNVFNYIRSKDSISKGEAGKYIIWSLVGLFIMISVWGLVGVIATTFFGGSKPAPVITSPLDRVQAPSISNLW